MRNKRGVLNRVQSSTVCNASATNFSVSPVFSPFSVTQTLIGYNNIRSGRRKALHGLLGHLFWEVLYCLKGGKELEITLETVCVVSVFDLIV